MIVVTFILYFIAGIFFSEALNINGWDQLWFFLGLIFFSFGFHFRDDYEKGNW